ncbi:MAG: hypothetical protein E7237_05565, partial [Sarcina sp.]|nr:hypothetical protein [Sarcina sp.]
MERDEKVTRLAGPVKKGLGHLLFSRLFLIVALLLLQVAVFACLYLWAASKHPALLSLHMIFSIVMIVYLFNDE